MTKQIKIEFLEWIAKSPDWFRTINDVDNYCRGKMDVDDMFYLQRRGYIVFTKNGAMLTELGNDWLVKRKISSWKKIKSLLKKL